MSFTILETLIVDLRMNKIDNTSFKNGVRNLTGLHRFEVASNWRQLQQRGSLAHL